MMLSGHLSGRLGALDLQADIMADAGEVVAVVGPNGAGKTTLLRSLAGLVPMDDALVVVDGFVLDDSASGVSVPTERRPIGFVFQDYLLFPHLSAIENVAFGLRSRGMHREPARDEAQNWLERMDLGQAGKAKPAALSGGQRQKVALARALATRPRLLLLDEPLAAVDVSARTELRRSLRQVLAQFDGVGVLVTHDPIEAFSLADRIIVMENGLIVQEGSVAEVASHPRSKWAADLMGLNLLSGSASRGVVSVSSSTSLQVSSRIEGPVFVAIAPRSVAIHRNRPEGSPRNVWHGEVDGLDLQGDRVRVHVEGTLPIVAEITPAAVADLKLGEGAPVWVSVKATETVVYPA
jgi:molybdate transport system ATP-binding protein